jgi:hypothetical protein
MRLGIGIGLGANPGGEAAPATPATILGANLLQWLEGPYVTQASNAISAVADQSANNYSYTQGTAASKPTYELGGFNGQTAWIFDGSNDFLIDGNSGAFATALAGGSDKAWTMWIAGQWLALAAGGGYMWSCGNTGSTLPHMGLLTLSASSTRRGAKRDTVNPQKNVDSTGQDLLRHVWTLTCDGTRLEVKQDNVVVAAFAADNFNVDSVTFNKDCIGCLGRNTNTLFGTMRLAGRVCRAGVATAGEDAAMYAYMAALNTASRSKNMLILAGDSLSLSDKWQVGVAAQFPNATIVNRAVGGDILHGTGGLTKQFRDITSNYDSLRPLNAAVQHYGSNDIALDHRTAAQLRADATTWAAVEAANAARKLIACTIHKRGGATPIAGADETERAAYNTDMRANYLSYGYHYLLDKDLIITEDPTDTNIFVDEIHLTDLGDTYLANGRNGSLGMISILQSIGFT